MGIIHIATMKGRVLLLALATFGTYISARVLPQELSPDSLIPDTDFSMPMPDYGLYDYDEFDDYSLTKRAFKIPDRYKLAPAHFKHRGVIKCRMWHWKTPSSCRFVTR